MHNGCKQSRDRKMHDDCKQSRDRKMHNDCIQSKDRKMHNDCKQSRDMKMHNDCKQSRDRKMIANNLGIRKYMIIVNNLWRLEKKEHQMYVQRDWKMQESVKKINGLVDHLKYFRVVSFKVMIIRFNLTYFRHSIEGPGHQRPVCIRQSLCLTYWLNILFLIRKSGLTRKSY